jgi:hypothetical protein
MFIPCHNTRIAVSQATSPTTPRNFRFTIREMLLLMTVLALIAGWLVDRNNMERKVRDARAQPFAMELDEILKDTTSIEIGQCGPQMKPRSPVIDGAPLRAFTKAATVIDAEDFTNMPISSNFCIELQFREGDKRIAEYTYFFPNRLHLIRNGRWYTLTMSDEFEKMMTTQVFAWDL